MAKYISSVSVSFNANDGGASWSANPETAYDVARHYRAFGKWRTRWIMFKKFWKGLRWMEDYAQKDHPDMVDAKMWEFNAEIKE